MGKNHPRGKTDMCKERELLDEFCRFYGTWLHVCFQKDLTFLLQVSS